MSDGHDEPNHPIPVAQNHGPYRCAGPHCKMERHRDTNHWWLMWESAGILQLAPWNDEIARWPMVKHLCGQTCAAKLQTQFMSRVVAPKDKEAANAG